MESEKAKEFFASLAQKYWDYPDWEIPKDLQEEIQFTEEMVTYSCGIECCGVMYVTISFKFLQKTWRVKFNSAEDWVVM